MKSLKNKTILITKSKTEAEGSFSVLIDAGAKLIFLPIIKVMPIYESPELIDAIKKFSEFEYVVFTSVNAVDVFEKIIKKHKLDFTKVKIAAVGESTAARCESAGLSVNILPEEFSAKGLIRKFSELDLTDKKILIPCSTLSRDELSLSLTEMGAIVHSVPVYNVKPNDLTELQSEKEQIQTKRPDFFVFTSPSSFENYLELFNVQDVDKYFNTSVICAIGPTTESAIRNRGLIVHVVPNTFSLSGIAETIIKYFKVTANMV